MDLWGSERSVEKVYEYTFCLSLVEALYPSELELPVISGSVQLSSIFSAFLELSGAFKGAFVWYSTLAYCHNVYLAMDYYRNGI